MTVYLVQNQVRYDEKTRKYVPRFDNLGMAQEYGELVELLPPRTHPYDPQGTVDQLYKELDKVTKQDYLLPIGNPIIVGMAMQVMAELLNGTSRVLQWSARDKKYVPLEYNLFAS